MDVSRRDFLKLATAGLAAAASGCGRSARRRAPHTARRVLILGFDGLDPHLLNRWTRSGHLPNFARLKDRGGFRPLRSARPPQSPVAWANFITGMDPSGHGIYDFIHRDPGSYAPLFSTSATVPASRRLQVGDWVIPISKARVELTRRGPAFWNLLQAHAVPATIHRAPSNFPPEETSARTLSGLGTPDLQGSYGHFSYFTTEPTADADDISGGTVYQVDERDGVVAARLAGPVNEFRAGAEEATVDFRVYLDPANPVARIDIQGRKLLLNEGEWSDWVPLRFKLLPGLAGCSGVCRFYLKSVRPLGLYVSPINVSPADPVLPICTPDGYAEELQREIGFFYTQGMAEDTKALSSGVFTDDEFLAQAEQVFQDQVTCYEYELDRLDDGLLFAYFSASDLVVHMFWRAADRGHPLWSPELARRQGDVIRTVYTKLDQVLGRAMHVLGDDALVMVVSDHGFAPFRRSFDLNAWLIANGYLTAEPGAESALDTAEWAHSRAYAVGFNGLYVNESGREAEGSVPPGPAKEKLLDELCARLVDLRDPLTGDKIVHTVRRTEACYAERPDRAVAPDAIVGFNRGYRLSWETAVGGAAEAWIADNDGKWSGDHCVDTDLVPGVVLCNRPIETDSPTLCDIAPTVLAEYGIPVPDNMTGSPVLKQA